MLKKEIAGLTNNFDEAYYGEEALAIMKMADEKYNEGVKEGIKEGIKEKSIYNIPISMDI